MNTLRPLPRLLLSELVCYALDLRMLRNHIESELSTVDDLISGEELSPNNAKLIGMDHHNTSRIHDRTDFGLIERSMLEVRARHIRVGHELAKLLNPASVEPEGMPDGWVPSSGPTNDDAWDLHDPTVEEIGYRLVGWVRPDPANEGRFLASAYWKTRTVHLLQNFATAREAAVQAEKKLAELKAADELFRFDFDGPSLLIPPGAWPRADALASWVPAGYRLDPYAYSRVKTLTSGWRSFPCVKADDPSLIPVAVPADELPHALPSMPIPSNPADIGTPPAPSMTVGWAPDEKLPIRDLSAEDAEERLQGDPALDES